VFMLLAIVYFGRVMNAFEQRTPSKSGLDHGKSVQANKS
jgi:hypothetical protein